MMRTALASAALVAAVHASSLGNAIVVNQCNYDVYLSNTPSAGGGYSAINKVLSQGDSYSQEYTQLSNNNGWSLKLSLTQDASNLLQYEYTYQGDPTLWFDLSAVNGDPFKGEWTISANNGCQPRQAAYQYSTDDAYGMQACSVDASVTVTLCGSGSSGSPAGSSPASSPQESSAAPATTSSPTTQPWTPPSNGNPTTWGGDAVEAPGGKVAIPKEKAPSTTLTTSSVAWNGPAVTVTNVQIETQTQYVTATAAPPKRHVHHPRHPHNRL